MDQTSPEFHYLSHEEFDRLTRDQKITYLARAIASVTQVESGMSYPRTGPDDRGHESSLH